MRRLCNVAVVILLIPFLVVSCNPQQEAPAEQAITTVQPTPAGPLKLTIVHSNDTWGYLWPCG